ncbi:MAG: HypC/HybG/HupF family hydrogenase formation chaperone [Thermoplasmata archaeon]|nr:HypC/HybG/HupF family hydrogenase formation chaperone [Thermoplasmata archaeon]
MCLAIPGRVEKIEGEHAIIDYGGAKRKANISLVDVKVGDYVIVHAGFAIQKIREEEARKSIEAWKELLENA